MLGSEGVLERRATARQSRCVNAVPLGVLGSWEHFGPLLRGKEMKKSGFADAVDHALKSAVQLVCRVALMKYVRSLAMSIYGYTCYRSR